MKIAYQGIAGSYSETVIQTYLKEGVKESGQAEVVPCLNFPEVLDRLTGDQVDLGVFPVENSTTGLITRTLDLFKGRDIFVEEERYQPVRHTLWGLPESSLDRVRQVYSHPEALSQCQSFFEAHPQIEPVPFTDTAQAAWYIHDQGDPKKAALAGPQNGELYQLVPLLDHIQTEETNTTRFFLAKHWSKTPLDLDQDLEDYFKQYPDRTRWMVYVETKHQPGSLVRLLNIFDLFDCNLEGLDARPIANQPFRYGFFIEVDVSNLGGDYQLLWQNLAFASEYIQIIGAFKPLAIN